ncbi:MAG: hypothetical protein AAGB26_09385 [Planctomycetota bacterium]
MKAKLLSTLLALVIIGSPARAQQEPVQAAQAVDTAELRIGPAEEPVPEAPAEEAPAEGAPTEEVTPAEEETAEPTPAEAPQPAGVLRFHLMDGTIITGKLTADALPVSTEFGDLTVPINAITNFAPGLGSHPEIDAEITRLIQDLGSPDTKMRDKAQSQLISYGPSLLPELREYNDDADAERKVRIAAITEELLSVEDDGFGVEQGPSVSLARLDQIVTKRFTIAGKIKQDTFSITSKFGELTVKLGDIKGVERVTTDKPEMRKVVEVAGTDMTCRGYKKTGIRVNRGDRIIISAEGRITMSPWGSNSVSGPDGIAQNGMYNGKIPMGALAGRIGDSGEEMLIGSKKSFVAKKSGVLQLGFAMQQNWANYQFPGSYKTRIRVVPGE